jgi:hypothetical protein
MAEPDMQIVAATVNAFRSGVIDDEEFLRRLTEEAGFRRETAIGVLRYEQSCADAARFAAAPASPPPRPPELRRAAEVGPDRADDASGSHLLWVIVLAIALIVLLQ